jgi:hypothetical protein
MLTREALRIPVENTLVSLLGYLGGYRHRPVLCPLRGAGRALGVDFRDRGASGHPPGDLESAIGAVLTVGVVLLWPERRRA